MSLPIQYEVKRTSRFEITFENLDVEGWQVAICKPPRFINGSWGTTKISFFDTIVPSIKIKVFEWIEAFKKSKHLNFTYTLSVLDPTGVEVEKSEAKIIGLLTVDFDKNDCQSEEIKVIEVEFLVEDYKLIFA